MFTCLSVCASETDERIESSAKQSYVFKTYLNNDTIKIQSKEGVVTLTGTVAEAPHKLLAEETVASLPGVKSVDNQLEFVGDLPAENSDAWIGMKVKTLLLFKRNVSAVKTEVSVKDGIVTLKGLADNQAQKDLSGEYAKDVEGVKDVKNEMILAALPAEPKQTMGEKIDDASITTQIKIALLWHRSTSAFRTGVETTDGVVKLTGRTTSAAGKDMVTKIASDIKGVTEVINNMIIVKGI
ncbi:MAG: BON domain-containing protein [Syntrophaceae bacterium]|nr:BON domain-containing protein [Syntrophaceae bacterium]